MLNKLKKGQRELSQELGRTPTVTELAQFVDLPEDEGERFDVPRSSAGEPRDEGG
jgi:DNA-directed RNA polymerase sigma subunit (sigma70/sigma32)